MFNKLDSNRCQSFFSEDDADLAASIGNYLSELFESNSAYRKLQKKHNKLLQVLIDQDSLLITLNGLTRRSRVLEKLLDSLDEKPYLCHELLNILKEAMACKNVSVFSFINNSAVLELTLGLEDEAENFKDLAEYACFVAKKATNIKDLSSEPLFNGKKGMESNSCLLVPFVVQTGLQFVICYKRELKEFSNLDLDFSDRITEKLQFYLSLLPSSKLKFYHLNLDTNLESISKFSIPVSSSTFDFYHLFSSIKENLIQALSLNSCSIYIADQITNQLWTKNSNSSSSLFFPFSTKTLVGHCYINRQIVFLPSSVPDLIGDLEAFNGKKVLAVPVLSNSFENSALGVIICIRTSNEFSNQDLYLLTFYMQTIARVLEGIYAFHITRVNEEPLISPRFSEELASPKSLFREINLKNTERRFSNEKKIETNFESNSGILDLLVLENKFLDECKEVLRKIEPSKRHHLFFGELEKIIKVEKAIPLLIHDSHYNLFSFGCEGLIHGNEALTGCMVKKICEFCDLTDKPKIFDQEILEELKINVIKHAYLIPIININSCVIGVLALCNFESIPNKTQLSDLNILGKISGSLYSHLEPKIWQTVNESKSMNLKFNQWAKVLYRVGKVCISNLIRSKSLNLISNKTSNFQETLKYIMQAIACITNCTVSELRIANDAHSIRVSNNSFSSPLSVKSLMRLKSDSNHQSTMRNYKETRYELRIPIKLKNIKGQLKVVNLHKSLGSDYVNDTVLVVSDIRDICLEIAEKFLVYPDVPNDSIEDLMDTMKIFAFKYKPTSFYISIQKATQCLLDCEHAIFCLKQNENIIIPEQKCDLDIPDDCVLEQNQGIITSILESGAPEIIEDVYLDERFNTKLDKLTGYLTLNILCTPLIYNNRIIGAIKAINKKEGEFNQNDLEVMHKLSESICLTLDLIENIQASFEERSRLTAIMNAMDKHVIVLNDQGNLVYSSKPTTTLFNLPFESIEKTHFSDWVSNPDLKADLSSVLENPKTTIQKYSQKFTNYEECEKIKQINYSISQIAFFSSECYFGVILIIEDSLLIDRLYNEFKHVRNSVVSLTSPITGQTKLHKTIEELRLVQYHINDPELNSRMDQIIYSLQEGNLNTPKLIFNKSDASIDALTSILEMPNELFQVKSASSFGDIDDMLDIGTNITLNQLRDWDLNPFQIDNHIDYIVTMLKDYDLISSYKIDPLVLMTFLTKVKDKYSYWKNPFHNFMHGFNVMHGTYMLLSSTPAGMYFSSHQILALLIASLCHDIDHRGRTNIFEVNKRSLIANTYHDKSVLEKHHAAVTFYIINEENSNIFSKLNNETYMAVRKLMISSILSTDMAKHLGIIEESKTRFMEMESKKMGLLENDIEKLAGLLTHCSDLFHPCKSYAVYEIWSILVCKEFTDQYYEEIDGNLPVTSFFKDLDKPQVYYSNEIGFLGYIVKPLWLCLKTFLSPHINHLIENIENNIEVMKKKKDDWIKLEDIAN